MIGHPVWCEGPRVRIETLRKGERFIAIDGQTYARDRGYKRDADADAYYAVSITTGKSDLFAACAEVVPVERETDEERLVRRSIKAQYGHLPIALLRMFAHERGITIAGRDAAELAFAVAWYEARRWTDKWAAEESEGRG